MKKTLDLRPLRFKKSPLPQAEGSCLVSMGKTTVLCAASVENEAPPHAKEKGIGWIHAEYAMLPRAGEKRSPRHKAATGGRAQEISRLVGRALRASVDLVALAPYSILIDCDVIRADGGTRTASVNGGFVALAQALRRLVREKKLAQWPVKNFVGAVSVGLVNGKIEVDMDYASDKDAGTDLNVVMTEKGDLVEVQATAERGAFSKKQMDLMLAAAKRGILKIIAQQKKSSRR